MYISKPVVDWLLKQLTGYWSKTQKWKYFIMHNIGVDNSVVEQVIWMRAD